MEQSIRQNRTSCLIDAERTLPPDVYDMVDEAVFSSRDPQQALHLLVDTVIKLLKADRGTLRLLDHRTGKLIVKASRSHSAAQVKAGDQRDLGLDDDRLVARVARTRCPRRAPEFGHGMEVERSSATASSEGDAEMAVPVISSDGRALVGVVDVVRHRSRAFTPEDQDHLVLLAWRTRMIVQRLCLSGAIRTLSAKVMTMDQDALLAYTVEVLSDLLHVPVCSIWLLEEGELRLKRTVGRPAGTCDAALAMDSFIGRALAAGEPVRSSNVLEEPDFVGHDLAAEQGWVSALAVPILSTHTAAKGVVAVYAKEARDFAGSDINLADELACHVATALSQSLLIRQTRIASSLQAVGNGGSDASSDKPRIFKSIVDQAAELLDATGGLLYVSTEGLEQPVVVAATGTAATLRGVAPSGDSLANWVMRHKEPVRCQAHDRRLNQEFIRRIGAQEIAAVPLVLDDAAIGTLVAVDKRGGQIPFDSADVSLLKILADQATLYVDQMRTNEQRLRRTKHLHVINDILSESLSSADIDSLLQTAAQTIRHEFNYRCNLGVVEGPHLIFKARVDYDETLITKPLILPIHQGVAGQVAMFGNSLLVPDVSQAPIYRPFSDETRSELAVPLVDAEVGTIGVLNLESQTLGAFAQEDIGIFQAIAAVITHAINHTRRLREFTALHRISTAISRGKTLDDILRNTVDEVRELFQASVGAVFLADRGAHQLRLAYHNKYPEAIVPRVKILSRDQSIAGKVLASGESIVVWEMSKDKRSDDTIRPEDGLSSLVDVPIKTDHGVIGVLAVLTKTLRPFSNHDVSLLESIGGNIGVAIERAQAEMQFKKLYHDSLLPILTMCSNGRIEDVNEAACAITGYTRDALLQMNIFDIVLKDQDVELARERLGKAACGEVVPSREFAIEHRQGHPVTIEAYLTPNIDSTGRVTGVQAMWRDITDRKRDEAVKQCLLHFSRTAFRTFDRDDLMPHVANTAMELLESDACVIHLMMGNSEILEPSVFTYAEGWQTSESRLMRLRDGLIGHTASNGRAGIFNACRDTYLFADDRPQHVLVMPVKSADRLLGALSLLRHGDSSRPLFTEEDSLSLESFANMLAWQLEYRRRTELQHRQDTAEQVLEEVGLAGAMLGHKLRGFLGAVSLTTQELQHRIQANDPATGALMNNLIEGSRTAARLNAQFLSMQKPLNQETTNVELQVLINAACRQVEGSGKYAIERHVSLALPAVKANGPLLTEVFEGLIRNAMDAMPTGGKLSIRAGVLRNSSEVWLQFIDSGHGITEADRNRLFTPFFTTKGDGVGLGLGLWLSRLYMRTIGGDIKVSSRPGEGTIFTVSFPASATEIKVPEPQPELQRTCTSVSWPEADSQIETRNVLIVEDQKIWHGYLTPVMQDRGIQVRGACN